MNHHCQPLYFDGISWVDPTLPDPEDEPLPWELPSKAELEEEEKLDFASRIDDHAAHFEWLADRWESTVDEEVAAGVQWLQVNE